MAGALRSVSVALLVALASCQSVLDIEDAEVDPTLDDGSRVEPSQVGDGGTPSQGAGGTICELYCQTVTQTCTGDFAQYTTFDNCLSVCEALPPGSPGDVSGNSAYCRLQAGAPHKPRGNCRRSCIARNRRCTSA